MKLLIQSLIWALILFPVFYSNAQTVFEIKKKATGEFTHKKVNQTASCAPATASAELNINNIRAVIQAGGDMWWD